ncbi:MAG: hypothetical protein LBI85_08770 [Spirochaetaceae bacterium]|jgi:hypothetical protein|nr:hypothetical protein [Spirochaetaceae bacterium]
MKGYFRRKTQVPVSRTPAPLVLLLAALLCPVFPLSSQTRTEEWVETGRFGTEETEENSTAGKEDLNDQWVRLGLRAGPSLRFYTPENDTRYTGNDTHAAALDLAFQANLRVLPFLSVQAEAVLTWDNASLWAYTSDAIRYTRDYTAFSLQFPLLVKLDFYPGRFKLSPFLGLYYLAPLGRLKASNSLDDETHSLSYRMSPPLGFTGGMSGALALGPGALIADLRYASDFGSLEAKNGSMEGFRRAAISLTVGYEMGFFSRKGGTHD